MSREQAKPVQETAGCQVSVAGVLSCASQSKAEKAGKEGGRSTRFPLVQFGALDRGPMAKGVLEGVWGLLMTRSIVRALAYHCTQFQSATVGSIQGWLIAPIAIGLQRSRPVE